ncbi:glycosyltransferase [Halorubellus sp. JP-L1]|uniref:glycosyltransferase family 2 protein n=1 Tax=Halorubellus sp. JP-L1 TaxID=2715753 RepID=UPI0014098E21|nr:glycosyltransferase family 2 protein [Halorubellus sp. JP-L1]NHN40958.1 glycosyltransferase [Halorubellus sp. JP-L1]
MNPCVSVIIPVYNRFGKAQRAINSVANQTYDNIQLIIVDDNSEGEIEEHISIDSQKLSDTSIYKHSKNRGANAARNTGIDEAYGDYLAFLDSDDEWEETKISKQVENISSSEAEFSYTWVKQVDESNKYNSMNAPRVHGNATKNLINGNVIGTFSSVMVQHGVIKMAGKPNESLPLWQDWEWFLRLSRCTDFTGVKEPLTIRHNEGEQISDNFEVKRDEAYPQMLDCLKEFTSEGSERKEAIANLDYSLGYSALSSHRYPEARKWIARAIRKDPTVAKYYIYLLCSSSHYPLLQKCKRSLVRIINN